MELNLNEIPKYNGKPYFEINKEPEFNEVDFEGKSIEYSDLDHLGRCGMAYAKIGTDLISTRKQRRKERIKPSGWHTIKYDIVDHKYLYNRCHLIGYQLTKEKSDRRNLITGTRYMNIEGMSHFEDEITKYIEKTGNHVYYRVTPIFHGDNLVASGVQMEGKSFEDSGAGILFNVYAYNVQPGIVIDYATGCSYLDDIYIDSSSNNIDRYILNKKTKKFHYLDCPSISNIEEKNKAEYICNRDLLILCKYSSCTICNR